MTPELLNMTQLPSVHVGDLVDRYGDTRLMNAQMYMEVLRCNLKRSMEKPGWALFLL